VNPQEQNLFFEKIVRGLYFHLFQDRAPKTVTTVSPQFATPGLNYDELGKRLLPYLSLPGAVDSATAHPEIFKYRYYRYTESGREGFIVRLTFYKSVVVVGMCTRTVGGNFPAQPPRAPNVNPVYGQRHS
jgi:hypothetical protein